MIIACFICSFYLGLAGEVGKTKLVLESGYGFGFGLVFVHVYGGGGRGLQVSPCAYVEVRGQEGFQSTPSTTENARLASLQTSTDSTVSILPSQHKSSSATDVHYCACWAISPAPEHMIFKNIFLWPSAESSKHPASLTLHGAALIWHFLEHILQLWGQRWGLSLKQVPEMNQGMNEKRVVPTQAVQLLSLVGNISWCFGYIRSCWNPSLHSEKYSEDKIPLSWDPQWYYNILERHVAISQPNSVTVIVAKVISQQGPSIGGNHARPSAQNIFLDSKKFLLDNPRSSSNYVRYMEITSCYQYYCV